MGYYTHYELSIDNADEFPDTIDLDVAQALIENTSSWNGWTIDELKDKRYPLDYMIGYETKKWYNHEDDMIAISKMFPDCKFVLYGDGEEWDDIWYKYFYNGKYQVAEARIEFDEPYIW